MSVTARTSLIGLVRCAFTTGFPFTVTIINLPQRFEIVNGKSPVDAGIRVLPLLLLSAVGSGVSGAIVSKKNVAFYVLIASNVFEILGTGLLSSLPTSQNVPVQIYPYMAVLGLGFGSSVVSLMVVTRTEVEEEDQGSSTSAFCVSVRDIISQNCKLIITLDHAGSGISRGHNSGTRPRRSRRPCYLYRRGLRLGQVGT